MYAAAVAEPNGWGGDRACRPPGPPVGALSREWVSSLGGAEGAQNESKREKKQSK